MILRGRPYLVAAIAAYANLVQASSSQPSPSPSPVCSQPRPSSLPSAADLAALLKPQIASVCSSLGEKSGSIASDLIQGFVFFGGPAPGRTSDCEQAFQDIILQCVQQKNYYGGELVYTDTQLYNLTNARGTLNPILSGSGSVQLTTPVSIATPAAPTVSSNSSQASLSMQLTTSQSSQLSGSAQTVQTSSNTSSTALSFTISHPSSNTNSTSLSASSSGSAVSSTSSSRSPSSTPTGSSVTGVTSPSSSTSPLTASTLSQSRGPSSISITSSMSTTLPPTAAASATNQASTALAAVASYSRSPTKENADNAKSHIDDALAAAVLLAAGTTGALAAAFGGLVAALETAQTAAIAAAATPGAATVAALAADAAAVETALMEEEKAEEEEQNSSKVTSQSDSNTVSSSSLITSSASLSSTTSSSSSSCSATGTGSVCSSGLIPIYTIDADMFANVQDVLDAAHISSRLAAINAEGSGSSTQSNASTIASSTSTSSLSAPLSSPSMSSSSTSTPTLNCQQNIPSGGPAPSQVANALTSNNGIATICAAKFDGSGDSTHQTFNHGSIDIELIRTSAIQALAHCIDALNSIINTCILGSADYGGVFSQDGETYNVTNTIAPANPLIPGTDPGAPPTTAIAVTTQQSAPASSVPASPAPVSSAPPAPPTPSQIKSNNKGSALCHSLEGACKVAYKGYNDTWLYTQYTSYVANPGGADPINFFFAPFANDGCTAIFDCDNNDAFSVGMLGSQIKAAFDNLFANDNVKECGSSYLSNSCHVTVNGCSDCRPSIPCGALPDTVPGNFPCYGGKNPNAQKRAARFRQ